MADTKPFASLSSGLLARKGGAKPAMRPQGYASFGGNLEDLGWNDMGLSPQEHVPTPIDALTPYAGRPAAPPPVVEQQRALEESYAPEQEPEDYHEEAAPEPEPVVALHPVEPEPEPEAEPEPVRQVVPQQPVRREARGEIVSLPRQRAHVGKAKAAFTLRLDPERHLKLRLASAFTGRSSQQLVTEALDAFVGTIPELESLVGRAPAGAKQSSR